VRRGVLDGLKADLAEFPLAGGRTLYDWAESFVTEGEALDQLLSSRADVTANVTSRAEAGALRSTVVGKLGNLRDALTDELEENDALPPNLEALIFGYFEELDRLRELADKAAPAPVMPDPIPEVLPVPDPAVA
jgi:hypothetical protein